MSATLRSMTSSVRMLSRLLRRFNRNGRGTTAVEFGLIAMPLFAIICCVFEIAYCNIQDQILSNAVSNAARAMMTGKTQTNSTAITTAQQFVTTYLCQTTGTRTLPSNFNCNNLIVDVRPAASFAAGDTSRGFYNSSSNEFCPGQPGAIMVMRVAYPLPAILPINLFSRSAGVVTDVPNLPGKYHILLGEELFMEELYSGSYTPPTGC